MNAPASVPISFKLKKIFLESRYALLIFITSCILLSSTLSHFITVPDAMWLKDASGFSVSKLFHLNALRTFRPVYSIYLALFYRAFGLYFPAYYSVNLILHAVNAVLVYVISERLLKGTLSFYREAAFLSGMLFSVLFSHYQALVVLCNVHDTLMTLFCLLSFLLFIAHRESGRFMFSAVSVVFFLLALLTKEPALFFPFAMLPAYFLISPSNRQTRSSFPFFRTLLPYFIIMMLYSLHYVYVVHPEQNKDFQRFVLMTPVDQIMLNADSLYELVLSSFSVIRDPYYWRYESFFPFFSLVLAAGKVLTLAFATALACAWLALRERFSGRLLWLILFFSGWTVINFFPTTFSSEAVWKDFVFSPRYRYFYLPSVGLSWLAAVLIAFSYENFKRRREIFRFLPVALAVCLLYTNGLSTHIMSSGYGSIKQNYKNVVSAAAAACKGRCGNGTLYFVDFPEGYANFYGLGPKPLVDLMYDSNVSVQWVRREDLQKHKRSVRKIRNSYFLTFSQARKTVVDSTLYYRKMLAQ